MTNQTNQKQNVQTTWQKAVKKVMKEATQEEALQRYGTKSPSFNYRWEHVTAVVTTAIKLAELTGADRDIVEAAAWLHDIRKEARDRHPQEGARFAKMFLPTTDFPPEKIEAVAKAIKDHMGLWRNKPLISLESQVLWDADKLAKIGVTAVFHWVGDIFAKPKSRTTDDILQIGLSMDWQEKTVASMHTKPAQKAARARFKVYNKIWSQLESELSTTDLS